MDELERGERVSRGRRRWQLGVVALILVGMVGAVVWVRGGSVATKQPVSAAAGAPLPVVLAQVKIGTTSIFLKNVGGLTIGAKVPGTGLTFSRGLTSDTYFADWLKQLRTSGAAAARRNVTITLLDATLTPVRSVSVTGALPVSLTLAPIDGTNPVMETLKLSYTDIAPG